MKIPLNLEHKPIFVVEDYYKIDCYKGEENTDAQGLSIGIAQWSDRYNLEICKRQKNRYLDKKVRYQQGLYSN